MILRRQFVATLAAAAVVGFAKAVPERGACGVCSRLLTDPNDQQVLTKYARCALHGGDGSLFDPRHAVGEAYRGEPVTDRSFTVRFAQQYDVVRDAAPHRVDAFFEDGGFVTYVNGVRWVPDAGVARHVVKL